MREDFIRNRITELRLKKGVSEYKMSTDMGHSKSYIQSISSGRSLPSWSEFFFMCDYFGITPHDFFNDEIKNPEMIRKALEGLKALNDDDVALILQNIERLLKNTNI